jgi:hypothetical protein
MGPSGTPTHLRCPRRSQNESNPPLVHGFLCLSRYAKDAEGTAKKKSTNQTVYDLLVVVFLEDSLEFLF